MNTIHPTDDEIVRALEPWMASLSDVLLDVETRQLQAIGIMGLPTSVERAGWMHVGWRTLMRAWCDETNGLFRFVEEGAGKGLDCIVCHVIEDKPFLIRLGRMKDGGVKRNSTVRQMTAQAYGTLSSGLLFPDRDEPSVGELRQVTLAYEIEGEGTEGGVPAWYVSQLRLVRESPVGSVLLRVIEKYRPPTSIVEDERRAVATPNNEQLHLWRRQIKKAKKG